MVASSLRFGSGELGRRYRGERRMGACGLQQRNTFPPYFCETKPIFGDYILD
jgi:hypothetical protein